MKSASLSRSVARACPPLLLICALLAACGGMEELPAPEEQQPATPEQDAVAVSTSALGAQQLYLDEIAFVAGPSPYDRDNDGLKDDVEFKLADHFKPYFIFDSAESHRLPNEPVTLFRVYPVGNFGGTAPKPWRVAIKYAFLFKTDGGYGPSSDCFDAHNGDIGTLYFSFESNDGQTWKLTSIKNSLFIWPQSTVQWYQSSHPTIYLSSHKHHQYFSTANDEQDSPHSDWGCNDDVDGLGAKVLPSLRSPYPDKRPNNVGEPGAHDPNYFISTLDAFGYPGENAWGYDRFTGGLPVNGGDPIILAEHWLDNQNHTPGPGFSAYTPRYVATWVPGSHGEIPAYDLPLASYKSLNASRRAAGWLLYRLHARVENGQLLYNAVWRPGSADEIEFFGLTRAALESEHDGQTFAGWRLHHLQAYVLNGQVRYDAIFRPGHPGMETMLLGVPYATYQAKYDELWPQNMRIHHLQAYAVNGQVFYDGIWRAGSSGELQFYDMTKAAYEAKDNDLAAQGWQLHLLQSYLVNGEVRMNAIWRPGNMTRYRRIVVSRSEYENAYNAFYPFQWRLQTLAAH